MLPLMPSINLKKTLYDELIRRGEDPTRFINRVVAAKLEMGEEDA